MKISSLEILFSSLFIVILGRIFDFEGESSIQVWSKFKPIDCLELVLFSMDRGVEDVVLPSMLLSLSLKEYFLLGFLEIFIVGIIKKVESTVK